MWPLWWMLYPFPLVLISRGFPTYVALTAQVNSSQSVPYLQEAAFRTFKA